MRRTAAVSGVAACAALAAAAFAGQEPEVHARPDVVLVSIDTLRADALSCYGNARETTPHLDALARAGILFEDVLAQAPSTASSHATLFTGLDPWVHRASNATRSRLGSSGLDPAFVTLAERFAAAGYRTAAFTDGVVLSADWNLLQGFEVIDAETTGIALKLDRVLAFLDARSEERHGARSEEPPGSREARPDTRPLFLFVHTYQVHMPYTAPDEWASRFTPEYDGPLKQRDRAIREGYRATGALPKPRLLPDGAELDDADVAYLVALYHGELAYTDHELARLWRRLARDGGMERTVLAVTSDHGEEFGEHGRFGHTALYRETLHVPLILRVPEGRLGRSLPEGGLRVCERASLMDLHATLLGAAGLQEGLGLLEEAAGRASALSFAVTVDHVHYKRPTPWLRSIRDGDRCLVSSIAHGVETLEAYDLALDAGEAQPLSPPPAWTMLLAEELQCRIVSAEELRARLLPQGVSRPAPVSDERRRELEALGYAGDDE